MWAFFQYIKTRNNERNKENYEDILTQFEMGYLNQ